MKETWVQAASALFAGSALVVQFGCFLLDDTASSMTQGIQRQLLSTACAHKENSSTCAASLRRLDVQDKWQQNMQILELGSCVRIRSTGGRSNGFTPICSSWCPDSGVSDCSQDGK